MKLKTKQYLLMLSILISNNVFSLPDDFKQKLSIEANKVYLSEEDGTAIYEGNVVVTQGSIHIEAERLTISSSEGAKKYDLIYAKGSDNKLATFKQTLDIEGNEVSAVGEKIFYNTTSLILEISGNGLINKADDVISADSIRYLMQNNTFEAKKQNGGERVSITLQPQSNEEESQ